MGFPRTVPIGGLRQLRGNQLAHPAQSTLWLPDTVASVTVSAQVFKKVAAPATVPR